MRTALSLTQPWILVVALIATSTGCLFETDDPQPQTGRSKPAIPAPTSPENVLESLLILYNDDVRTAAERLAEFEKLFVPPDHPNLEPYLFKFSPSAVDGGLPPTWDLEAELRSHEHMFAALDAGDLFELRLEWQTAPMTQRLDGAWEISVSNINLRLLFSANDGFELRSGLANFVFREDAGRWYIIEWQDLDAI